MHAGLWGACTCSAAKLLRFYCGAWCARDACALGGNFVEDQGAVLTLLLLPAFGPRLFDDLSLIHLGSVRKAGKHSGTPKFPSPVVPQKILGLKTTKSNACSRIKVPSKKCPAGCILRPARCRIISGLLACPPISPSPATTPCCALHLALAFESAYTKRLHKSLQCSSTNSATSTYLQHYPSQ
jgi:hypothetical protein